MWRSNRSRSVGLFTCGSDRWVVKMVESQQRRIGSVMTQHVPLRVARSRSTKSCNAAESAARPIRLPISVVVRAPLAMCTSASSARPPARSRASPSVRDTHHWCSVPSGLPRTSQAVCKKSDSVKSGLRPIAESSLRRFSITARDHGCAPSHCRRNGVISVAPLIPLSSCRIQTVAVAGSSVSSVTSSNWPNKSWSRSRRIVRARWQEELVNRKSVEGQIITRLPNSWKAWTSPSSSKRRNSSKMSAQGRPRSSAKRGMVSNVRVKASPMSRREISPWIGRMAATVFGSVRCACSSSVSSGWSEATDPACSSAEGDAPAWRMAQSRRCTKLRQDSRYSAQ